MVAEGHGLGDLQVGESRHHGVRMALGLCDEFTLQRAQCGDDAIDLAAQPQAQVGGHLVVARAASVQPLAGVADEIGQPLLDVEVHILELEFPRELASFDIRPDLRQATLDRCEIILGDDLRARQHRGMGKRPFDIRKGQAVVELHRRGVAQHKVGHRFLETTGPSAAFRAQWIGRFRGVL